MVARNEMDAIRERLSTTERNVSDQAKTLTVLTESQHETDRRVSRLETNEAVSAEREKARDEWRKRTETKLDGIYRLGWWVLTTFGSLTMAALASILYGGGSNGP